MMLEYLGILIMGHGHFLFEDMITPLKTSISPERQWLEDRCPIETVPFWGTC